MVYALHLPLFPLVVLCAYRYFNGFHFLLHSIILSLWKNIEWTYSTRNRSFGAFDMYITLCYIAICYIMLHTIHYVTLQYVTLCYIQYIMLHTIHTLKYVHYIFPNRFRTESRPIADEDV